MRTCSSCGKGIADNTKFCPFCGAPCEQDVNTDTQENSGEGVYTSSAASAAYSAAAGTGQAGASKGLTIAGLVLGIVAIIFAFIPGIGWLGWICGIVGIVLSAISISASKKAGEKNGMAVAGLVLSILALAIGIILVMVACAAGCAIAGTAGLLA